MNGMLLKRPRACDEVKPGGKKRIWYSVMEESQVGVHQSNALLITGINHHLVRCRSCRSRDELDTTLQGQQEKRPE